MPARSRARVEAWLRSVPSSFTEPVEGPRPSSASHSSVWPFPWTPATPRISPARTWNDTPRTECSPRSPCTLRSWTSSTTSSGLAGALLTRSKAPAKPDDVVLDVQDLSVHGERGEHSVRGVSFQVRAGEILGVAGVQGNGQTELCEALMGLRPSTGSVHLNGTDLSHAPTRTRLHAGIG